MASNADDEYERVLEPRVHTNSLMATLRHTPSGVEVRRPVSRLRATHQVGAAVLWDALRVELEEKRSGRSGPRRKGNKSSVPVV